MAKNRNRRLDACFAALAHPTRRSIVEMLSAGPRPLAEIAERFDVAPPTISRHLGVLERAGLLVRVREGRTRRCVLVPEPLADADQWIRHYRRFWRGQFRALERYLDTTKEDA